MQDGGETRRALALAGERERHARLADRLLGAADALRHRAFRHQERAGDLGGGEAADGAQRERDRRVLAERRVRAHEQQDQRVVVRGRGVAIRGRGEVAPALLEDDGLAPPPRDLAADVVGHPPRRDLDQPRARMLRHALLRPLHRGGEERLLDGVLGAGEVAEAADHRAEHLRRERAQQLLGSGVGRAAGVEVRLDHRSSGGLLITWRTSIGMLSGSPPLPGAAEIFAAMA